MNCCKNPGIDTNRLELYAAIFVLFSDVFLLFVAYQRFWNSRCQKAATNNGTIAQQQIEEYTVPRQQFL
jgi:hypothetical protein